MSTPRRSSRGTTPTAEVRSGASVAAARRPTALSKRPALPLYATNKVMNPKRKLHNVKIQTLRLGEDDQTIVIARVKCPVPKTCPGHIIKRFDTDAVSASSLFRAAFPTAKNEDEEIEMEWISVSSRQRYGDTKKAGAEDQDLSKLSGTWIPTAYATDLATEYGIERYAADVIAYADPAKVESQLEPELEDSPAPEPARTKRQRILSPPAVPKVIATKSVAINQTVEVVVQTESMEVDVAGDLDTAQAEVDLSVEESTRGDAQIAESKALVELLKLQRADKIEKDKKASLKRAIEDVDVDDDSGVAPFTLHDVLVPDTRGRFGKIFRRAPAGSRRVPVNAGREIKPAGSQLALLVREEEVQPERLRWYAGVGIVLAIGATAAAPYLLG